MVKKHVLQWSGRKDFTESVGKAMQVQNSVKTTCDSFGICELDWPSQLQEAVIAMKSTTSSGVKAVTLIAACSVLEESTGQQQQDDAAELAGDESLPNSIIRLLKMAKAPSKKRLKTK